MFFPLNKNMLHKSFKFIFIICAGFFMFQFDLFAQESQVETKTADQKVWIKGELPKNSTTKGKWIWQDRPSHELVISHTGPGTDGIDSHSFIAGSFIGLTKDTKILQYALIDPDNPPSGIMLKFLFSDGELSVYWEGDEEAFVALNEYITAWYMGPLPERGKWLRLEIDFKEFDITDAQLEGMEFIVNAGKVWWAETIIVNS